MVGGYFIWTAAGQHVIKTSSFSSSALNGSFNAQLKDLRKNLEQKSMQLRGQWIFYCTDSGQYISIISSKCFKKFWADLFSRKTWNSISVSLHNSKVVQCECLYDTWFDESRIFITKFVFSVLEQAIKAKASSLGMSIPFLWMNQPVDAASSSAPGTCL